MVCCLSPVVSRQRERTGAMHRYDSVLLKQAARLHKLLAQQGGYPVLLSTGLCGALFAGRVYLSRTMQR